MSEAGRRGVGVGPCDPGIGRGRVAPEIRGVNHRVIRVVAVAPPDDQFISGPDGGVLKTWFGGVIRLDASPDVRGWIVAAAGIQDRYFKIGVGRDAAPDQHFRTGPDGGVVGARQGRRVDGHHQPGIG